MTRANRIAIATTDNGYKATFYRTHKTIAEILSQDTEWTPAEDANKTQAREDFRTYCTKNAGLWDIEWDDGKAQQAWNRKYQTYATNEQVSEDAITLLTPMVDRLIDKCKYRISLAEIQMLSIDAEDTNFSYIENGRYISNENWAWADITMQIILTEGIEIEYHMALRSGQICKPKLTIAEFEQMVAQEADLVGIELVDLKAQAKADKDAEKKASKSKAKSKKTKAA